MKTRSEIIRNISFLLIVLLVSLTGWAQEEHHMREPHGHPEYAKIKNPIAKTKKSVAEGRKLYEKHCIACHGKAARGGIGPDLTVPSRMHGSTDGEIFHVVADGVAGTAMKGFGKDLSDEMRWNLVNYITSLRKSK